MTFNHSASLLALFIAATLVAPRHCQADVWIPSPWSHQVEHAAFVGIAECSVAGLVTAKYRVLESWKGPPAGSILTIDQKADRFGAHAPFTLCGERFFICAYPYRPETRRPCDYIDHAGCGFPYWWRESGAPLYTGVIAPPYRLGDRSDLSAFGLATNSFRAYRDSVRALLTRSPEMRNVTWDADSIDVAHGMPTAPDSQLEAHRVALNDIRGGGFAEAFEALTRQAPKSVVEFFERDTLPRGEPDGYALASYFAGLGGKQAASMLHRLLAARDLLVQVTSAMYLAFEDSVAGERALREFAHTEGFAGALAATSLANRGDKASVPRALEAFELPHSDLEFNRQYALKGRLLVLLSNSAASSGLEAPPVKGDLFLPNPKERAPAIRELRRWWNRVGARITLRDPWIANYEPQQLR